MPARDTQTVALLAGIRGKEVSCRLPISYLRTGISTDSDLGNGFNNAIGRNVTAGTTVDSPFSRLLSIRVDSVLEIDSEVSASRVVQGVLSNGAVAGGSLRLQQVKELTTASELVEIDPVSQQAFCRKLRRITGNWATSVVFAQEYW